MLTKELIKKQATAYFNAGEKYDYMNDDLMEFLGSEFVAAPASTKLDTYNAFEGGLVDHILRVTRYALKLNDILPEDMQQTKDTIVKVCCLFQIGKAHMFIPNPSQWHRDKLGQMYEFNNDQIAMRVGERSIRYATSFGIELTDNEYQAIINYDKLDTDRQAKYHTETLGMLLKQANDLAIMEEKKILEHVE